MPFPPATSTVSVVAVTLEGDSLALQVQLQPTLRIMITKSDGIIVEEDPFESLGPSELLILSRGAPRNKEDLIALLPSKNVMDRLMNRYFNANSPCQRM